MKSIDLIAAHMIGDYILQTNKEAMYKTQDLKYLNSHVCKYTLAFIPFLLGVKDLSFKKSVSFLSLIYLTHLITDSKRWASGEEWPPKPILVDQAIHATTLAILNKILED